MFIISLSTSWKPPKSLFVAAFIPLKYLQTRIENIFVSLQFPLLSEQNDLNGNKSYTGLHKMSVAKQPALVSATITEILSTLKSNYKN